MSGRLLHNSDLHNFNQVGSMSSDMLVVAALGRPFTLGALYDARQDILIPGFTLWDDEVLKDSTVESSQCSSAFEIIASDSIDDKSNLLDIEASLKASFLGGLIEVEGSAKYLNDTKKFKNQSRVTLQYKATTNFKQLMTHLGSKHVEYSELFENIKATHVVIGILYGANAFFVFDSGKVDSSNVQDIQGSMEAMIKKIPSVEISGKGAVQLTSEENAITNNFSCNFHGDFILTSNPTTFEDAVQTYQQLPQMMGKETSVPMTVWLVPLTSFYSKAPQLAADSNTPILRKIRNTLEAIRALEMRCNDSLEDNVVKQFPQIRLKLNNFKKLCHDYMLNLRQIIAKKLLSLRSGDEDENSLLEVFKDNLRSPFNIDCLNMWLECEEREINVVRSCMDIMEGAKPKVVSDQNDMFMELIDGKVKHALCFVFTYVDDYDNYLSSLKDYSESKKIPRNIRPAAKQYWHASDYYTAMVREKAHLFNKLAKEMDNRSVRFLVRAEVIEKQNGAVIHHYTESIKMNIDFTHVTMPKVETIRERQQLIWYDCELTMDPDTAHPALTLSEGNKKAVSGKLQKYENLRERFDVHQQVMCNEALSGRHYWEVDWVGCVRAGVTFYGTTRKGSSSAASLGHSEKSWVLDYCPSIKIPGYHCIHNNKQETITVSSPGFKRLGVYLDWPAGTLSFYMVDSKVWVHHIHTFRTKFDEAVYPAFLIGVDKLHLTGSVKLR